jgi:zinc transporter 1/2/3
LLKTTITLTPKLFLSRLDDNPFTASGIIVSLILYKFIAGILILLVSLVSVIYPIRARVYPTHNHILELGDAFASGIFLGAGLFHMLPDAIASFSEIFPTIHYPLAESICAGGFLFLLFLERLSHLSATDKSHTHSLPYMLAIILIVHSLIEGAALGVNSGLAAASIIFVAIIAHKGSESFALAVILNRSQLSFKAILSIILIFSIMTPIGIGLGTTLTSYLHSQNGAFITALFNAFAAGTFLYMSTLHHINHHHRVDEAESLLEFFFLLVGLVIMAVIAGWA